MAINHHTGIDHRLRDVSTLPHILKSRINLHAEMTAQRCQSERTARLLDAELQKAGR